jgi:hypothetical protein
LGGIFLASQPQPDDFKLAKDGGIKAVVNLRKKDEVDWDEETHVKTLGMEYHNIAFQLEAAVADSLRISQSSRRRMVGSSRT